MYCYVVCSISGVDAMEKVSWKYARLKAGGFLTMLGCLASAPSHAQVQHQDPEGAGPIIAAMDWLQGSLLGNVATTAAVIAVAAVGFMMLTGRMNWRYGITVVVGCFVLFGATSIVAGIRAAAGG